MKKLVLTSIAALVGATLVHAQGTVTLQQLTTGLVWTNSSTGSGQITQPGGSYFYEVLDMTSASWTGLSANQQAAATNLLANPSDVSLWTDSGVSGSDPNIGTGAKSGISGGVSTVASNWGAPQGATYSSGSIDYYVIVGWSSSEGSSWSTVSAELSGNTLVVGGFFGETYVAFNYAGGGTSGLGAPTLFGSSPNGTTGLAGSGGLGTGPDSLTLNQVTVTPEPGTLALAAVGGISMLLLRRRKS